MGKVLWKLPASQTVSIRGIFTEGIFNLHSHVHQTQSRTEFSVLYSDSGEVNNKTAIVLSGTGLVPLFFFLGQSLFFLTIIVSPYKYSSIIESLKLRAVALLIFLNSVPHGRFLCSLISQAKKKSMITIAWLFFSSLCALQCRRSSDTTELQILSFKGIMKRKGNKYRAIAKKFAASACLLSLLYSIQHIQRHLIKLSQIKRTKLSSVCAV